MRSQALRACTTVPQLRGGIHHRGTPRVQPVDFALPLGHLQFSQAQRVCCRSLNPGQSK